MLFKSSTVQSFTSTQIQSKPSTFIPYKPQTTLHALSFFFSAPHQVFNFSQHLIDAQIINSPWFNSMACPMSLNHHPTQQLPSIQVAESLNTIQSLPKSTIFPNSTYQLPDATQFLPDSSISFSNQLVQTTTSLSKFLPAPTKLLSYCYCSPFFSFG